MPDRFSREKEQILTQYILHHELDESEVGTLAERLDRAVERAVELHGGQRRKTGEDYVWHPVRTAMEVSRFGRIVDWASLEAALLHDTIEDTGYTFDQIRHEFPEASNLVLALTKIKDSQILTYQKLFRFVLQDIRVLLVKLADRLDNLESLSVFGREKQVRIARETSEMYANICRRLCMLDVAERLTDKVGPILHPEAYQRFTQAQAAVRDGWTRQLDELRLKLSDVFPGDLAARIDTRWSRFTPDRPPTPENLFRIQVITRTIEDAYRALGRVHTTFPAVPGAFLDTVSNPRKNGFRALATQVSYQGRIVSFYLTSQTADRFNRLGLLAMDITSPEFNLEYLEDLKEFLANEDMDIQDFLRFHRPDSLQVSSPTGEVFSLEEGATALDYAFSVHEQLGLRAQGARVNDEDVPLNTVLRSGDRIEITAADEPVADDRYIGWSHTRRALTSLRRFMRDQEAERAASTGRQWLIEAAEALGLGPESAEERARAVAASHGNESTEELYRKVCLGDVDIADVLGSRPSAGRRLPGQGLLRRWRERGAGVRRVRRYNFDETHIRFCPVCVPVEGDDIEGTPEEGRLLVHRAGCVRAAARGKIPLQWEKGRRSDLRDPGPVELEISVDNGPGVLYALLSPFRDLGLEIQQIRMPQDGRPLVLRVEPGSARTLNRLLRTLRRHGFVREIRVFRAITDPS